MSYIIICKKLLINKDFFIYISIKCGTWAKGSYQHIISNSLTFFPMETAVEMRLAQFNKCELELFRCHDIWANFFKEIFPHHLLFIAAKPFLEWRSIQCTQGTRDQTFNTTFGKFGIFTCFGYSLPWSCCDSGERFPWTPYLSQQLGWMFCHICQLLNSTQLGLWAWKSTSLASNLHYPLKKNDR